MALTDVSVTSDKDYLEISEDGAITISADGTPDSDSSYPVDPFPPSGFAGSTTVNHGLGTIPMVRAFWDAEKNGTWYSAFFFKNNIQIDPWLKVISTTSTVKLIMNTNSEDPIEDIPVYYRIYKFGDKAITSDERVDKIFLKDSTSAVLPASVSSLNFTYNTLTIPHGMSVEVPIWSLEFSVDNENWYAEGTKIVGDFDTSSGPPGGPYARYYVTIVTGYIDDTNFYIQLEGNNASNVTVYVRYSLDLRS